MDRPGVLGPPWTNVGVNSGHDGALTGARPPAAPGLGITGEEAGEVEEATVSTFVCSSELGRRGIGGATGMKNRRRSGSVGARSGAGERERRAVSGAGCSGVESPPFIGVRGGCRAAIMAGIGGGTGGGVIGDFKCL